MIKQLISLYRNHIGNKFFTKLVLLYVCVLIAALSAITIYISVNTSFIVREKQLDLNRQAMYTLQEHLDNKLDKVKDIIFRIYSNKPTLEALLKLVEDSNGNYLDDDPFLRPELIEQLFDLIYNDGDIRDVILSGGSPENTYLYIKDASVLNHDPDVLRGNTNILQADYREAILPTRLADYRVNNKSIIVYGIINTLVESATSNIKGKIIFDMDIGGLDRLMASYKNSVKGNLVVITQEGDVVYDSSGRYYFYKYPYTSLMKGTIKEGIVEEDSYIETCVSEKSGLIYASIIPKSKISKNISMFKNTTYIITVFSVLFIFIMYYAAAGVFSRKIRGIIKGIKAIGSSNLSYRIPISDANDEIVQIASHFNDMCDNLQEHIYKSYVYELKQKNAELQKLQAQINPHFLYNTLEAIRSRVVKDGNEEAGEMIQSLAVLFRMSIKGESVVEIGDELEYCKMYMNIFNIRYEDYFSKNFDIDPIILSFGILKNLLQPVLENYIVHGFNPAKTDNRISIKGIKGQEEIRIVVSDNGFGMEYENLQLLKNKLEAAETESHSGIGLPNVHERIRIVFGKAYGLSVESILGEGTTVTLRIPAKTKEEILLMMK